MKAFILYPADYFSIRKADPDYGYEYKEAVRFPELTACFYNYDVFVAGGGLKLHPEGIRDGICICRGWMLKPEQYAKDYGLWER